MQTDVNNNHGVKQKYLLLIIFLLIINFSNFISVSASKGLYIIRVKIADYEDLSEEVEASFQIVGSGFGQVQIYFFIILGVLILVAILVITSLFVTRRRR